MYSGARPGARILPAASPTLQRSRWLSSLAEVVLETQPPSFEPGSGELTCASA